MGPSGFRAVRHRLTAARENEIARAPRRQGATPGATARCTAGHQPARYDLVRPWARGKGRITVRPCQPYPRRVDQPATSITLTRSGLMHLRRRGCALDSPPGPYLAHPRHQSEDALVLGCLAHLQSARDPISVRHQSCREKCWAGFGHRPFQQSLALTASHDGLVEGNLRLGEIGGENHLEELAAQRVVQSPGRSQTAKEVRQRRPAPRAAGCPPTSSHHLRRPGVPARLEQIVHLPKGLGGLGEVK